MELPASSPNAGLQPPCGLRVISGRVFINPDRQYIGEEERQKEFFWGNIAYAFRICPEKYPHYTLRPGSTPEREIDWLLRHAYPNE